MTHDLVTLQKIGEETGRELISASCTCGWRSQTWYSVAGHPYMRESFQRHVGAIDDPEAPAWMLAPGVAA